MNYCRAEPCFLVFGLIAPDCLSLGSPGHFFRLGGLSARKSCDSPSLMPGRRKPKPPESPEPSAEAQARALAKRYVSDAIFRQFFEAEKTSLQDEVISNLKAQAEIYGLTLVSKDSPKEKRTYTKRLPARASAGSGAIVVATGSVNGSDILAVLDKKHANTNKEIVEALAQRGTRADAKSVSAAVKALREAGSIKKIGEKGPYVKYLLS